MQVHELYGDALRLIKDSRIKEGMKLLDKALIIDDKDVEVLNLMGLCNYIYCNFKRARYYFEKSSKLEKKNKATQYMLTMYSREFYSIYDKYRCSLVLIDNRKYSNAINMVEELKVLNKELITPYEILYLLYRNIGKEDLAFENIEMAYILDKSNEDIARYYNEELKERLKEKEEKLERAFYLYLSAIIIFFTLIILWIRLLV